MEALAIKKNLLAGVDPFRRAVKERRAPRSEGSVGGAAPGSRDGSTEAFSLAEVLIAMTLFLIFTTSVVYLSMDALQRGVQQEVRQEALFYAVEGLEAVRSIRDRDFLLLTNGDHGLAFENDQWSFIAAPEEVDGFYDRTITIYDVYRNDEGEINGSESGTFDPETKKITVEIDWLWRGLFPKSITVDTYLTNWTGDDWVQTTCTEWTAGTFENLETVSTESPPEDDCALELAITETQSDFFASADAGKHGNDVDVSGNYAYLATADTNKGLTIIDVSNPAIPVVRSQLNVWGKGRKIAYYNNRVYMGIESNAIGVAIVNVTNPVAPAATYAWNVSGYGNQTAVASAGDYFYMGVQTTGNSFLVYRITSVPTLTDFLDFDDEVNVVELNGSYAYLGCENDSLGFRVINITDKYNISQTAAIDVGEEVNAIELLGNLAYVGTDEDDDSLQWLDISNPGAPTVLGSLDVGGEIADLVVSGDYLYAAVDDQNQGLAVINISNPLAPYVSYQRDIEGKGTGIDVQGNYVYISTDTSNKGLVIVSTVVSGVQTTGTYTSVGFDTGSDTTRYNFIEWEHTEVAGGSVELQIRTADSEAGLATATWVGSDGTSNTSYENSRTEIVLDPNRSGQRFFQFQVVVESDGATTPTIESVRLNYTP